MRATIAAALLATITGCAAPLLSARFPAHVRYAGSGPRVAIAPIADPRPNALEASVGYVGLFQTRSEWEANEDTPPARVVRDALASDLAQRGLAAGPGGYDLRCQMPQFLLRYRNYAGMWSATDAWGYLDLVCSVTASGQMAWQGPIYARHHRVFYTAGSPSRGNLEDDLWPELMGALIQQTAAILNRVLFRQAAAPELVAHGRSLLASTDADQRFEGAYLLGVSGDPAVIPLLARATTDPEEKVRRSAVDALGTLGAAGALPGLLRRFDREEGNVQWAILKSILQIGDPAAYEWLRRKTPQLESDTLREIAEDVLRHPPRPPAAPLPAPPAVAPPPPAVPATP